MAWLIMGSTKAGGNKLSVHKAARTQAKSCGITLVEREMLINMIQRARKRVRQE